MTTTRTSSPAPPTTVAEVSRATGLSEATLRYYERVGLIGPVPREASSGHRSYPPGTVRELEALACLRAAGLGIADMRRYRHLLALEDATGERELFEQHADELRRRIADLELRLAYLEAKTELWSARERGEAEEERAARTRLIGLAADLIGAGASR